MRTSAEWLDNFSDGASSRVNSRTATVTLSCSDIRAIQADALREAAKIAVHIACDHRSGHYAAVALESKAKQLEDE